MRPEDLARELGIDGKRLRGWLRHRWPRRPEVRGLAWLLTDDQVAEARRAFAGARSRSSGSVIVRPASPPVRGPSTVAAVPSSPRLSWLDLQHYADAVLASGLRDLLRQRRVVWSQVDVHTAGVYVFAEGTAMIYVGESTTVSRRVEQHLDPGSANP